MNPNIFVMFNVINILVQIKLWLGHFKWLLVRHGGIKYNKIKSSSLAQG